MIRPCIDHAASRLRRKWFNPYLSIVSMVLLVIYTLQMGLISGKLYLTSHQGNRKSPDDLRTFNHHQNSLEKHEKDTEIKNDFEEAKKFLNIYKLTDDYKADFQCVELKTNPRTPVCVYDAFTDMYISHDLIETGLWEKHVLFDFLEDLKRDESLGVLDIGANIGVYSLLAAKLGRQVVAIEPYRNNILRLHRSAVLAGTTRNIVVLENAVSDLRDIATLRTTGNNQGDTRIKMGYRPCIGSCPTKVKTILISDAQYVMDFDRAIMKIDIQGFEHLAFLNIEQLLKHVTIPYIYMEWLIMKTHSNSTVSGQDTELVKEMIQNLFRLQYRPHSLTREGATELDAAAWYSWPLDIVWRHLPSQREYSKLLKNHFMVWP